MELNIHLSYEEILIQLLKEIPQIKNAVIATFDGILIASTFSMNKTDSRIAALMAAIISLSKNAVNEMQEGIFNQISIKGSDGSIIILQIDPKSILLITLENLINLKHLLHKLIQFNIDGYYPFQNLFTFSYSSRESKWMDD